MSGRRTTKKGKAARPDAAGFDGFFLGSDGAVDETFGRLLADAVDDHLVWRRAFGAAGAPKRKPASADPVLEAKLGELKARLRTSAPFHSPYYIAHMASDVLVPGLIGYTAGLLYNQNNIAMEKSPSTTPLELEVARQLAAMVGYDPKRAWGHLTSGGTVANFEGLWAARNLKAFPFAALEIAARRGFEFKVRMHDGTSSDIRKLSPVEILNLPIPEVMRMRGRMEERVGRHAVSTALTEWGPAGEGLASLGDRGVTSIGRILLPGTKHYSWLKVAEALGVGRASLRFVELDSKMRMKRSALEARIRECRDLGEAVLAVVAVLGSTAEGAVDPLDQIAAVQRRESRRGTPFYLHADAAFGGYARTALIPRGGGPARSNGPFDKAVAAALKALPACDSVTVDPHKLGYVPVPAGSILFRDEGIRGVLATPRPYFSRGSEDWRESPPSSIGGFILEGTKPGAAAAACWLAHQVLPLDRSGFGALIARSKAGADEVRRAVRSLDGASLGSGRRLRAKLLTPGDLSILCFALNPASNRSLARANAFNRKIYKAFAIEQGGTTPGRFILSSTVLRREEYGDAPLRFLEGLGVSRREWERVRAAFLLRAVVLSPEVAGSPLASAFAGQLREAAAAA